VSQPTKVTHGLKCGMFEAHLNGAPLPTPDSHDPAKIVDRVALATADGAGVRPTSQAIHGSQALRILVALEEIPDTQFRDLQAVVNAATKGGTVSYSPLGSTTWTSTGWTLVSTTADWTETRYGIWSGTIELAKLGGSL
jgi:hypothetical protein